MGVDLSGLGRAYTAWHEVSSESDSGGVCGLGNHPGRGIAGRTATPNRRADVG